MLCSSAQGVGSGFLGNWIFQACFKGDSQIERYRNPGGGNKDTDFFYKIYFRGNVQPASASTLSNKKRKKEKCVQTQDYQQKKPHLELYLCFDYACE